MMFTGSLRASACCQLQKANPSPLPETAKISPTCLPTRTSRNGGGLGAFCHSDTLQKPTRCPTRNLVGQGTAYTHPCLHEPRKYSSPPANSTSDCSTSGTSACSSPSLAHLQQPLRSWLPAVTQPGRILRAWIGSIHLYLSWSPPSRGSLTSRLINKLARPTRTT